MARGCAYSQKTTVICALTPHKLPQSTYKQVSRICNHHAKILRERWGTGGARDRPTDRTQPGCRVTLSEISDCGDERAGDFANGAGSWPVRATSSQRWKTGPRLLTPRAPGTSTTAQSQLVRVGGIREREGRPQLKCQELSSNKEQRESEEYHHQKSRKAGETETKASQTRGGKLGVGRALQRIKWEGPPGSPNQAPPRL